MKPFDYYEVADADEEHIQALLKQLPHIPGRIDIRMRLALQMQMTSKYFFVGFMALTFMAVSMIANLSIPKQLPYMYVYLGAYSIMITLLIIPEILRSKIYHCEEIERSCKFSYVQILYSRIMLFSLLLIVAGAGLSLYASTMYEVSFLHMYIMILLLQSSSFLISEGLYLLCRQKDIRILLLLQLLVSLLLLEFVLPYVINMSAQLELGILVIASMFLFFVSNKVWKEILSDETLCIEFN